MMTVTWRLLWRIVLPKGQAEAGRNAGCCGVARWRAWEEDLGKAISAPPF